MFLHITEAEYLEDYKLSLKFNDGSKGTVDLEPELYGEVFEPLKEKSCFQQFFLTGRTVEWPNGADFAPEFLREIAQLAEQPERIMQAVTERA